MVTQIDTTTINQVIELGNNNWVDVLKVVPLVGLVSTFIIFLYNRYQRRRKNPKIQCKLLEKNVYAIRAVDYQDKSSVTISEIGTWVKIEIENNLSTPEVIRSIQMQNNGQNFSSKNLPVKNLFIKTGKVTTENSLNFPLTIPPHSMEIIYLFVQIPISKTLGTQLFDIAGHVIKKSNSHKRAMSMVDEEGKKKFNDEIVKRMNERIAEKFPFKIVETDVKLIKVSRDQEDEIGKPLSFDDEWGLLPYQIKAELYERCSIETSNQIFKDNTDSYALEFNIINKPSPQTVFLKKSIGNQLWFYTDTDYSLEELIESSERSESSSKAGKDIGKIYSELEKIQDIKNKLSLSDEETEDLKRNLKTRFFDGDGYEDIDKEIQKLLREHKYQEARSLVNVRFTNDKSSHIYHSLLATTYFFEGDSTKAISHYQEALKTNPNFYTNYYRLGELYQKNGDIYKAIGAFRNALNVAGNEQEKYVANGYLVSCYFVIRDDPKATECLEEMLLLARSIYGLTAREYYNVVNRLALNYTNAEMYSKCTALLASEIENAQKGNADTIDVFAPLFHAQGFNLLTAGDLINARSCLLKVCELLSAAPKENHELLIVAYTNLAKTYEEQVNSAIEYAEHAKELATQYVKGYSQYVGHTYNVLANLYGKTEKRCKAVDMAEVAYENFKGSVGESHPDTIRMLINYGISYSHIRKFKMAKTLIEKAIKQYRVVFGPENSKINYAKDVLEKIDRQEKLDKLSKRRS